MLYEEGTLGHQLVLHQNEYGFEADQVARQYSGPLPSASILIPYYDARATISSVIAHLLQAIAVVRQRGHRWHCEIIVVDDGSERAPLTKCLDVSLQAQVRCETACHQGRGRTRNHALSLATHQVVFFVDADVLLHPSLLHRHLALHAACEQQGKGCISLALLDFQPLAALPRSWFLLRQPYPNDWRVSCIYQEAWYGCERDKRFAGERFQLLTETNQFRAWPMSGFYGPWMLPNMVLGGCFAVSREKALAVGGCSPLFDAYAFEETSLVTKLLASFGEYVIPLTQYFALHLEDTTIGEAHDMKYALFRKAHRRYFEQFLVQKDW